MKKLLVIIFCLLLSSCFWSDKDKIEDAKKDLLWDDYKQEETKVVDDNGDLSKDISTSLDKYPEEIKESQDSKDIENAKEKIKIDYLTKDQFIILDDISEEDLSWFEVKVTWKTNTQVDKIEVLFSNETSDFPDDQYTLQSFNPWDSTFLYVASSNYRVYDYGENEYIFKAYSWDQVSELKLSLIRDGEDSTIENDTSDSVWYEKKLFWNEDDTVYISFPKSSSFWDPVFLSADTFTYSLINNFEVKKENNLEINCSNITTKLSDDLNTWFYWNTCRDIIKDKWISFYVIRLWEDDNYFYEKHYIDYDHWLYWVYLLEKWTWVDKDNIKDKNDLLKEINDDFKSSWVVDELFRELVR